MSRNDHILDKAIEYIEKYGLDISPEQLFVQFRYVVELHKEFEAYLKDNNYNYKIEGMNRCERSLARRRLFAKWYLTKYQNEKMLKEILVELSEIAFTSKRTIQNDVSSATTT